VHNASTCAPPFGVPSHGRGGRLRHPCPSAIRAEPFVGYLSRRSKSFTEADCHVSSNPHVHRTPATDSRRSANPTSRMGQAKWRIPQVRFLRRVSHGNARHFDAKRIQRIDRSSSSRARTGSDWKLKSYGIGITFGITYLGAQAFVAYAK
jgi:hypothetical protein